MISNHSISNNMEDRPKCGDCRYYAGQKPTLGNVKGTGGGMCLRFPPTPMLVGIDQATQQPIMGAQCPPVAETHMCGEFSPKNPFAPITPFQQ